jgi:hypothetical protein
MSVPALRTDEHKSPGHARRAWAVKLNAVHYSWRALMVNQYEGQPTGVGAGLSVLGYFGEFSVQVLEPKDSCTVVCPHPETA